jgi:FkbM family methyltransferase
MFKDRFWWLLQSSGVTSYVPRQVVTAAESVLLPVDVPVRIGGSEFNFSVSLLAHYFYTPDVQDEDWWIEGDVSRAFADLVESGDVVYDVGASHGYYAILAATQAGPDGTVVAFEPYDRVLASLRSNVERGAGDTPVAVSPVAVGDRATVSRLELAGNNPRIDLSTEVDGGVETTTIDEEAGERPPDVVKIDTEGTEAQVIEGATSTLERHRPRLLVEVHDREKVRRMGGSWRAIYESLAAAGYDLTFHWDDHPTEEATDALAYYEETLEDRDARHHIVAT